MNRGNMAKQITEAPMKKPIKKKPAAKKLSFKRGGTVDQSMCSPRKQMAMGKMK
jgi:hypothetical protein